VVYLESCCTEEQAMTPGERGGADGAGLHNPGLGGCEAVFF